MPPWRCHWFVPANREREFPQLLAVLSGLLAEALGRSSLERCQLRRKCLSADHLSPERSNSLPQHAGHDRRHLGPSGLPAQHGHEGGRDR